MPIFADPTELRATSRLPALRDVVSVDGLEALTGADLMLSVLSAPASTEVLIRKHIAAGAILVQRKSGEDLINSMGAHLNDSLERMFWLTKRPAQNVLLFSGLLAADHLGMALVDGRTSTRSYAAALGALSRWAWRGGVVETVAGDEHIPGWCAMKLHHLEEYAAGDVSKMSYPETALYTRDPLDPFQTLIRVHDGRVTLATLPGIGEKTADELWTWGDGNLARILDALCDPQTLKRKDKPRGVGPATIRAVRLWMGYDREKASTAQPVIAPAGAAQKITAPAA